MSTPCRVLESKECEITQGYHSGHIAYDLVNKNYTLGNIVAHSDGEVISLRNNCNINYNNSIQAIKDWGDSYGNYVLLKHDNLYTFYAHMAYNSIPVKVGDKVKAGQKIGYMSNTGHASGGHLHFEVRTNTSWTSRIDPTPYFNKDLSITLPPVVSRDINKNQIEVVVSDLNVRSKPNTLSEVVYFPCKKGIYDFTETINGWYKIKENMWVNEVGLVIHKKEEVKVVEEEPVIEFKEDTGEEIIMPNQNKENALLWFVSIIVKFINKITGRS